MCVLNDAAKVYNRYLSSPKGSVGYDFIVKRGIDPSMITSYKLGSTPPNNLFTKVMRMKAAGFCYKLESLEQAGLLYTKNEMIFEKFSDSVIFPVIDTEDRVLTLTSRRISGKGPKYNNLSGFPIISLYGLHQIKNRYKLPKIPKFGNNYVILCEGQPDTIITACNGYFALGVLGVNNFKISMLEDLELFDHIILGLDQDAPGQKASHKIASHIRYHLPSIKLSQLELPEGCNDLNDLFLKDKFIKLEDLAHEIQPNPKKLSNTTKTRSTNINDPTIDKVLAMDIKSVVERVSLVNKCKIQWIKETESTYVTQCPFNNHKDDIGSFTVYKDTNSFYCFGCGIGGNAINFLMHFFGVSYREVKEMLESWRTE